MGIKFYSGTAEWDGEFIFRISNMFGVWSNGLHRLPKRSTPACPFAFILSRHPGLMANYGKREYWDDRYTV